MADSADCFMFIFLVLFAGGLGLAIVSLVFGSITDAVGGLFDGLDAFGGLDSSGFGWISFTTICIGISGTGAGGFLFNSMNIPPILALLIGLVVGFLCAYAAGRFIIVPLKRRQYSGDYKPEESVGKTATVIAPMSKGAMGQVMVEGRCLTARPMSTELNLSSGDIVKIVRIEGTIAFVDKEGAQVSPDESKEDSAESLDESKEDSAESLEVSKEARSKASKEEN